MTPNKLFIFIPTYNRPDQLLKQIENLIPQLKSNANARVLVSDNNSSGDWFEQIKNRFNQVDSIEFHQNLGNVGANANFLLAYNQLKIDEYLWLLADDTEIAPKAVEVLLEAIKQNVDLIALISDKQKTFPEHYKINELGISQILEDYHWGLISSAIYKASYIKDSLFEGFYFHNSSFPHLAILFAAMHKNEEISIKWINSEKIHQGNSVHLSSDYGLSVTGFPLLFNFAPKWERKLLTQKWIKIYGGLFYSAKDRFPENFHISRQVLLENSGLMGRLLLALAKLEYSFRKSNIGIRVDRIILNNPKLLSLLLKTGKQPYKIDAK